MRVVQITTSSKGGAGIAALRLHKALQQAGIASAYLSMDKTIDFNNQEMDDPFFAYQKPSFFKRIVLKTQKFLWPSEVQRYQQQLLAIEAKMNYEIVSFPFSKINLENHPLIVQADLLNLHWVGQLLDYERFFSILKKPVVWTLHDMNPFMGIFHYKKDEQSNSIAKVIDNKVKVLKQKAILKIQKGAIVSPSKWMIDAASSSGIFNHFQQKTTIPNGIDLTIFQPSEKTTIRERFGIKNHEKVLLFTSGTLDNPRKGMRLMLEAMEHLTIPVTLLTLGKGRMETTNKAVKIIPLGFMSSASEIAACYVAANVFILPSLEDNLPNTMLESLASGTPLISFALGGMKEHISNGFNGIFAKEISGEALAKAIELFFENIENYNQKEIRNYAEAHFSFKQQAEAYIKVYNNLLIE